MLLTGEAISAERAFAIGLVNRVVSPEALDAEVETLATLIASKSAACVSVTISMWSSGTAPRTARTAGGAGASSFSVSSDSTSVNSPRTKASMRRRECRRKR